MIAFPSCKINLGLSILAKREDGYHDIETCFYPVPICDVLEMVEANSFSFSCTGLNMATVNEDNLVIRAYRLLQEKHDLPPVAVHLHKVIPSGAGLGGGSSDAASTLMMLNHLFSLKLSVSELENQAAKLGSDCPFFIHNKPMFAYGKGVLLTPCSIDPLRGKGIIIIKPEVSISTSQAYRGVTPAFPKMRVEEVVQSPIETWRKHLHNDFEDSILKKNPLLLDIKTELYRQGAIYASMSGSGSALFGIFEDCPSVGNWSTKGFAWSGVL